MDFKEFVKPELLLLVPVLYALGVFIKNSKVLDWKIPFILGGVGIGLSIIYLFSVSDLGNAQAIATLIFTAITQGVLVTATAVFGNQLVQQATAGRHEDEEARMNVDPEDA